MGERGQPDNRIVNGPEVDTRSRIDYGLDKHILRDAQSRQSFQQHPPSLDETQRRVLAELQSRGISMTSLELLLSHLNSNHRARLVAIADRLLGRMISGVPNQDPQIEVSVDDPLFRLGLERKVLDVVNSFYQLWSRLNQFGMSVDFPASDGSTAPRKGTQRWHRDQWKQVRVFLYLSDVDEGNGALEYIPGSRAGGRHADLCPMPRGLGPDYYLHTPDGLVEERVPRGERTVCSGPLGSIVFCDTVGLHRGGYARSRPRVMATWSYYQPSVAMSRDFRCLGGAVGTPIADATSFALG
jgi:hypothetical protein